MNEAAREKALVQAPEIDAIAATLPVPAPVSAVIRPDDAAQAAEIAKRKAELDGMEGDAQAIIQFGAKAQTELVAVSDQMLEGVRSKDVGPAGDSLREMVLAIRGFDISELQEGDEGGWWNWVKSMIVPVADLQEQFNTVRAQIDRITDELLAHETTLLKDIKSLDKLYETSLDFYHELALYIAAGREKLDELDQTRIPELEAEVEAAAENDKLLAAQTLRDVRQARDDLERRVHDLKLTRQVTMQSLPSIRLVQENDKSLVGKINSTIVNTVPLWQTQLAQAIALQNSRAAGSAVAQANDLTNDLLKANADTLRESNREIREQMERGVVDMEALKHSHAQLIATIEESLAIADQGKARRAAAEAEMQKMETELRSSLAAAKASKTAVGDAVGDSVPKA